MQPFDDVASNGSRRSRSSAVNATAASSSTRLSFRKPMVTRLFTQHFPIFTVLLTEKTQNAHFITIIGIILFALQSWAFLVNPHFTLVWSTVPDLTFTRIIYASQLTFYDPALILTGSPVTFVVIAYVILAMVAVAIGCILLERRKRENENDTSNIAAFIGRHILELLSTALFIPLCQFCFAGAICGRSKTMWMLDGSYHFDSSHYSSTCWGAMHIATFIPCIVSLLLILPLLYITTVCVYDYNSLNTNFMSQRHSMLNWLNFFHRLLSCLLFNLMMAFGASVAFAGIHAVQSLFLVIAYMYFLPYYTMSMNRIFACIHGVEFAVSVMMAVQASIFAIEHPYSPIIAFWGYAIISIIFVAILCPIRLNPQFDAAMRLACYRSEPYVELNLDDEDNLDDDDYSDYYNNNNNNDSNSNGDDTNEMNKVNRNRHVARGRVENDYYYNHQHNEREGEEDTMNYVDGNSDETTFAITDDVIDRLPFPHGINTSSLFSKYIGLTKQTVESIVRQKMNNMIGNDGEAQKNKSLPVIQPYITHIYSCYDVPLAVSYMDMYARTFGITQISSLMTVFGVTIYSRAMTKFTSSTQVMQNFASFIITFVPGMSFMAVDLLKQTLRGSTSLDQKFRVLKQSDELRVVLGIRTHAHSIRCNKARAAHSRVLMSLHKYWAKFIEPSVNIQEVSEVADEIHKRRQYAIECFDSAIRFQQSADHNLVHRLGDFFAEVMMAPDAAQECYLESREIYQARQAHGMRGTRKNTTDIDVDALKQRMLRLLHFQQKGGSLGGNRVSSSALLKFVFFVSVLFVAQLVCAIGFVLFANTLRADISNYFRGYDAIAQLRSSGNRFTTFAESISINNSKALSDFYTPLYNALMSTFTTSIQVLVESQSCPKSTEARSYFTQNMIPMYILSNDNSECESLLHLSESTLHAAVSAQTEASTNYTSKGLPLNIFLATVGPILSSAYDNLDSIWLNEERLFMQQKLVCYVVLIFILNALVLYFIYLALILGFRRTSLRRVFIFQLFTLIPYESVERLAAASKERLHQMRQEKTLKRSSMPGSNGGGSSNASTIVKHNKPDSNALSAEKQQKQQQQTQQTGMSQEQHVQGNANYLNSNALLMPSLLAGAVGDSSIDTNVDISNNNTTTNITSNVSPLAPSLSGQTNYTTILNTETMRGVKNTTVASSPTTPSKSTTGSTTPTTPATTTATTKAIKSPKSTTLKSCLKKSHASSKNATASTPHKRKKHVSFNPVIEVVGGGDETDEVKKDEQAAQDESDEEVEKRRRMSLLRAKRQTKVAKSRAVAKDNKSASLWALLYICVTIIIFVIALCLLALQFYHYHSYSHFVEQDITLQSEVANMSLSVNNIVRNGFRYVATGSTFYYQVINDLLAEIIFKIPTLRSSALDPQSLQNLLLMHKYTLLLANATSDACELASTVNGGNLSSFGFNAEWSNMNSSEILAAMQLKYPDEAAMSQTLLSYMPNLNKAIVLANTILSEVVVSYEGLFQNLQLQLLDVFARVAAPRYVMVSVYRITSLVLICLAVIISLILALTPLHRYVSRFLPRYQVILVALSAVPIVVLSILSLVEGYAVEQAFTSRSNDINELSRIFNTISLKVDLSSAFVFTLQPSFWFNFINQPEFEVANTFNDNIVAKFLTSTFVSEYTSVSEAWLTLQRLMNISAALSINAFREKIPWETPMINGVAAAAWDITLENDYETFNITTPETIYYTNNVDDLQQNSSIQYAIATTICGGAELLNTADKLVQSGRSLFSIVASDAIANVNNILQRRLLYVILTLILFVLPVGVMIWILVTAASFIIQTIYLSASKEQTSESMTSRYRFTMMKVRYALLVLALMCCASFAVGLWLTQIPPYLATQYSYLTNERDTIPNTVVESGQVLSHFPAFASTTDVKSEIDALFEQFIQQTSGMSFLGVELGMRFSMKFNNYMYGMLEGRRQNEIFLSKLENNCSQFCTGVPTSINVTATPDYGAKFNQPILQGMISYVVELIRYLNNVDTYDINAQSSVLSTATVSMFNYTTELLSSMDALSTVLIDSVNDHKERLGRVLLILSIVDLVLSAMVFVVVIAPIIYTYYHDEKAARLLLQMIPPDVRDQVPAITHHIETGEMSNANELRMKFEANEKLLENILPPQISARLKGGELPIADTHECVTILFTDFVGFTKRSSTMMAREIVDFLNEVFLEFDTVVEMLQLEKIKTIGDAFFMAGGLDPHIKDHALRVVEAGLMFFDALEEHNRRHPSRPPLQMRLGIHSGPVVAGVIGIKKVAFDLWGETVEIANAMESTGIPGCVHISEDTAKLVRGFFRLTSRGELPREKEHIPENMPKTYLVTGRLLPTPYMYLRRPRLLPINLVDGAM